MATAFIHPGPDRRPPGTDTVGSWAVPGIILAVERHRRRIAQILDGIDDLGRAAVVAGVAALAEGRIDAASLVAQLTAHLRAGDVGLERFVVQLAELPSAPPSVAPNRANPDRSGRALHSVQGARPSGPRARSTSASDSH